MTRYIGEHWRGCPHHRFQMPWLESISIAVSNNIDEKELARLAQEVRWGGAGRGGGKPERG